MTIERKNYPELGDVAGPYVHAVRYEKMLYVSGLTAYGSSAQTGSIAEQAEAILNQLQIVASQENSSLQRLIKVTVFTTSLDDLATLRQVLFQYYQQHLPASSMVQVAALFHPDLNIEIEAIIAVD